MPYIIYVKEKKGVTRGGLIRTRGNRPYIVENKELADKIRKLAIKKENKDKDETKKRLLQKLIKIKKI